MHGFTRYFHTIIPLHRVVVIGSIMLSELYCMNDKIVPFLAISDSQDLEF
jgi:hypothetical protein